MKTQSCFTLRAATALVLVNFLWLVPIPRVPAATLTTLVEFTDNGETNKGSYPYAGLIQASDGNFYGTTRSGGTNYSGTVFRMTPGGVLTTLVQFNSPSAKGSWPDASLVQGSDGNFYGTTEYGGDGSCGTIFRMTSAGTLTTLVEFTGFSGNDLGAYPYAALIQARDGNLWGTTVSGGTYNHGTVFQMTPAGVLTTLVEFTRNGETEKGDQVLAGVVEASDGNFYGTTAAGGAYDTGTLFRMTAAGVVTTLVEFIYDGVSGYYPLELMQASDGNIYGTTISGGTSDKGTIFRLTTNGVLTKLVNFTSNGASNKGREPRGRLLQASDGNLYGMTKYGGAEDFGTVFRLTTNGVLTTLVEFRPSVAHQGYAPQAGLVQGFDGCLYGTTRYGGANDYGTVFKLDAGLPPPNTRPCLGISGVVDGQFGLTFGCRAGQSYQIQASTDLQQWFTIHSNTAAGATFLYTDTNSPSYPQRFYRTLSP